MIRRPRHALHPTGGCPGVGPPHPSPESHAPVVTPNLPDPDWQRHYADRCLSPAQAVARIQPGQRVFLGSGAGVPRALVGALCADRHRLVDIEIVLLFTLGEAPYACAELGEIFTVNTFFVEENVRPLVQAGLADYTPIHISDIPRLFSSGQFPIDVALVQVAPPNQTGLASLGIATDIVRSAVEQAALVIAQVNPRMPWTHGDAPLPMELLDLLVPMEEPLLERFLTPTDAITEQIGRHIASLVEDGATLQFGIGRIPQSLPPFLQGKRNLGIHSEMISDTVLELLESGAITGSEKSLDAGEVVASFALGSARLYQALDHNPRFSLRRTEYVNNVRVIAHQRRMVAINSALQVDLTGQVCVDSLGTRFYSGLGGIVDFNTGASHAPGGKSIVAIPATARKGKVSRIVSQLTPGAGVALTRGAVHYVVTEYGIAYLFGKSIQERVLALIGVAHPGFRAQLLKRALRLGYLRPEISQVDGQMLLGVREWRATLALGDSGVLQFRLAMPADRKAVKEMLYALSETTLYRRFLSVVKRFPFQRIKNFLFYDQRRDVVVVGLSRQGERETMVAIGGYYLLPESNRAEVAFLVRDGWQGQRVGTFLMRQLVILARSQGLAGLLADTLRENLPMRAILDHCGFPSCITVDGNTLHYEIDLSPLDGENPTCP